MRVDLIFIATVLLQFCLVISASLSFAQSECKPHMKKLGERNAMSILTMINKAMKDGQDSVSENNYVLTVTKSDECAVSIEISTSGQESICKEMANTCPPGPKEREQAKIFEDAQKAKTKDKIRELEEQGKKQMEEKERRIAEFQKANPQPKKDSKRVVTEKGEHRLILSLQDNADLEEIKRCLVSAEAYFDNKVDIKELKLKSVAVPSDNSEVLFEKLKKIRGVQNVDFDVYGEPNSFVPTPNDQYFGSSWHLFKIAAPNAWSISNGRDMNNVGIAIIDSGIKSNHADLAPNLMYSNANDIYGHGTSVAGIIAAKGNNVIGVTGVNWNGHIYSYYDGGPSLSTTVSALYAAANNPEIRVVNMSIRLSDATSLYTAVDYAYNHGKVLVAAAGNDNAMNIVYPAAYLKVLSVGATDQNDNKGPGSNYGIFIDVSAPGTFLNSTSYDGSYTTTFSGTSAAAPVVSGLASLVLSVNNLNPASVYSIIKNTANSIPMYAGYNQSVYGRVNAFNALANTLTTVTKDWDLNGDGIHSLADALALLRKCVDISYTTQSDIAHSDVYPYANGLFYGDGILNISDTIISLQRVVGLI